MIIVRHTASNTTQIDIDIIAAIPIPCQLKSSARELRELRGLVGLAELGLVDFVPMAVCEAPDSIVLGEVTAEWTEHVGVGTDTAAVGQRKPGAETTSVGKGFIPYRKVPAVWS